MNFEKIILKNFRVNIEYFGYLIDYYLPVISALSVNLEGQNENELDALIRGGRMTAKFNSERMAQRVFELPHAKTYPALTSIILKELSRQTKLLFPEPEKRECGNKILQTFRSIYDGIERLPDDERIVMKIIFTPCHTELERKYLQFVDIPGKRRSAMKKLQNNLTKEAFLNLERWLELALTIRR